MCHFINIIIVFGGKLSKQQTKKMFFSIHNLMKKKILFCFCKSVAVSCNLSKQKKKTKQFWMNKNMDIETKYIY